MNLDIPLLTLVVGSVTTITGSVLIFLAARQRAHIDAKLGNDKLQSDASLSKAKLESDAASAHEKILVDANTAREKLLSEATLALQEQQSRYINDLQAQADMVSKRLAEVDTKLQAAQLAILACFNEKLELKAQLQSAALELNTARIQLEAANADLAEARAANRALISRLESSFQTTPNTTSPNVV